MEGGIEPASTELIARLWEEQWGLPNISVRRQYMPTDVEGLAWRAGDGNEIGLVTWAVDGDRAEIVSVQAQEPGRRIGSRLMDAAEEELRRRGVKTVHLVTTNDNHRAHSFYLRRGYRLVRLHLDAMDRVRQAKPQVPLIGNDGIPLRDMWELEREL
ncbi:MAG: GNAT family N-acetyltransferase [Chloroflexi bacterium]|nr:GNAT family N-acetyltransferase [Chloroflexota bacterium]